MEFPAKLITRGGAKVLVFAYVYDQPRPWLGAYLAGDEVDGWEYIPVSWCGNGRWSSDSTKEGQPFLRPLDIPELEEKEKEMKFVRAKKKASEEGGNQGME